MSNAGPDFDLFVHTCRARSQLRDDADADEEVQTLELVDADGCILREQMMTPFVKGEQSPRSGGDGSPLAFARFSAFKFPDALDVAIDCDVTICKYGCRPQCFGRYERTQPVLPQPDIGIVTAKPVATTTTKTTTTPTPTTTTVKALPTTMPTKPTTTTTMSPEPEATTTTMPPTTTRSPNLQRAREILQEKLRQLVDNGGDLKVCGAGVSLEFSPGGGAIAKKCPTGHYF